MFTKFDRFPQASLAEIVSAQTLCVTAVFYCLLRAAADAGHAVGAAFAPDGLAVFDAYTFFRAQGGAFSAADALACATEFFALYEHGIKSVVHNAAVYPVQVCGRDQAHGAGL